MMTNADDHPPTPPPPSSQPDLNLTLPTSLHRTPFLPTTPTLSPSPPLTFSTVIEDDHSSINAIAMELGRSLACSLSHTSKTPSSIDDLRKQRESQLSILNELTWRLIRHDISEDLIMRPAFARWLGREGKEMGDHDRKDHEEAREELLRLYAAFDALPLDVNAPAASTADDESKERRGEGKETFAVLAARFKALMAELAEHMKTESGTDIPRLESVLGQEESAVLARRYIATYVLSPGLRLCGEKVWKGGVREYVGTGIERFHEIWGMVQREGEELRGKGGKL